MVDPLTGFPVPNYFVNNVQTTARFNGNIARVGLNYHNSTDLITATSAVGTKRT